jgi:hypothetical protein
VALALFSASSCLEAKANAAALSDRNPDKTMNAQARGNRDGHLSIDASIRDLLSHAAFAGFGHLILPWNDRAYDRSMRLSNIGSLLPYHSHVNPGDVVTALNRLIDDASKGETVFYEFYTGAQKQQQPARENTGLFFFRGRPGAPFAVIAPGGGFAYVGSAHEGFPYAAAISKRRLPPRTGRRPSRTSSGTRKGSGSAPRIILCGAARPAREWRRRSGRTAWHTLEATTFQSRQPW